MIKSNRIEYLDAIRGIAAMMVVVYHFNGWKWANEKIFHFACFIFNGVDAVSFFFVLSGFVLSYKYLHSSTELDIKRFTFKRVLRLYPAFIITLLLNFLYYERKGLDMSYLTDIFVTFESDIWKALVMVRGVHKYYVPGWTLGVEMALSLLMPIFIVAAKKDIKLIWWFVPLSLIMGPQYINGFALHFCLGILLAHYYPAIKAFKFRESKYFRFRWLIVLLVFGLYNLRYIAKFVDLGNLYYKFEGFVGLDFYHYSAVASAAILMFVMNYKKAQDLLNHKFLKFIGKISYSIYLVHWLIIVFIMDNWSVFLSFFGNPYITFSVMLLITLTSTILLANLMYNFIEKPFILWSKKRFK